MRIKMSKLDSDTAVAKIKVLIGDYYERKGRGDFQDSYYEEKELLEDIDDILDNCEIDIRKVIVEKLELDKMNRVKPDAHNSLQLIKGVGKAVNL